MVGMDLMIFQVLGGLQILGSNKSRLVLVQAQPQRPLEDFQSTVSKTCRKAGT